MRILFSLALAAACSVFAGEADQWRAEKRIIDLHQHIGYSEERMARAVRIMDASGIGVGVNLSGGTVTGEPSQFSKNKALADKLHPRRFVHYMNLDFARWNEPDFSEDAARQIEEGVKQGAAGIKFFKNLGLYLRDKEGKQIKIDDPKLDAMWKRCGELGLPVSIHVADPKAFWLPYDPSNERWKELKDHRDWWFGDSAQYPKREELLEALDRVVAKHPKTTFVCVHFANNAEDLEWVEKKLDARPNMYADLAARIPEVGRHAPEKVRRLFEKHQDRILFATDFQVHNVMILGSSGSGPAPTEDDAKTFYAKHWRWLETNDKNFEHMTPIQGDWTISGIGLSDDVLRKIYFDNARKLLARSLPGPILKAKRATADLKADGVLDEPIWKSAEIARMEQDSRSGEARPKVSTIVRAVWTDTMLYLSYESPFTKLTFFEPVIEQERIGLWDKDVVEAFIAPNPDKFRHYSEYEVAPNGEKLDLTLTDGKADFEWFSNWTTGSKVDEARKIWTVEMAIPMTAFNGRPPKAGEKWKINTYRIDRASNSFLALNPTLAGSYHTPTRFTELEFVE